MRCRAGANVYSHLVVSVPTWRNWQTRWTQNPVLARVCGFDSLRRYHYFSSRSQTITATISKEEISALPIRRYEGAVQLVASAADLDRAEQAILAEQVVGLDTETRPAFKKGQSYLPSLVQVATSQTVFLFQVGRLDASATLTKVLEAEHIIKAGIALAHDLIKLNQVFPFVARGILDLGDVASRNGLKQTGVRNLAGLFLGFRITKGARTSNWSNPALSPSQIAYAASDAWVCRELYLHFQERGWLTTVPTKKTSPDTCVPGLVTG